MKDIIDKLDLISINIFYSIKDIKRKRKQVRLKETI